MINLIWLGAGIIFSIITLKNILSFAKSFRQDKYILFWESLSLLLSGFIAFFGYYVYYMNLKKTLSTSITIFIFSFFISGVFSLIIIRRTYSLMDMLKKKKKKLLDMNFVLENDSTERADDLEDMNRRLGIQTEILSEKERELKSMNSTLVKTKQLLEIEKRSVENKVVERTQELKDEKDKVENLLKQKNEFINQLSHDLRTPITPLINLLPILLEQTKNKEKEELLTICIKNTKYLETLVLNTLSLARLEAGNQELIKENISMKELIDEITHASNLKSENVEINNKIPAFIKISVEPLKMREVFENIITNSVKYNENEKKVVEISFIDNNETIDLIFKDNGIGIEPKYLNKIFDEFYKVDPSRHHHGSSGLGLSIAKRAVELHQGKITAFSEGTNKGAEIRITLPKK